ncbi:hypothetical protein [Streptomyces sp. AC512_CC834]|uniref:hypothetical protein n=1 Tax=Streptomyces sp. AC512_CC834 TaxID=2823691 RepID=UPI001C26B639|nr:hypothetical protein [Streptomyces sp. AC512_CC834]
MTRVVRRFVDYKKKDCGATSKELGGEEAAVDRMAEHRAETGHSRFRLSFSDYALVEPE